MPPLEAGTKGRLRAAPQAREPGCGRIPFYGSSVKCSHWNCLENSSIMSRYMIMIDLPQAHLQPEGVGCLLPRGRDARGRRLQLPLRSEVPLGRRRRLR